MPSTDTHRSNTNDSRHLHREGQAAIKTIPIAIPLWCSRRAPPPPLNSSTRWPLKSMDGNSTLRNSVTLHKRRSTKRTLANGYTPLSLWNLCKRFGHALKRTKDKRFPSRENLYGDLLQNICRQNMHAVKKVSRPFLPLSSLVTVL